MAKKLSPEELRNKARLFLEKATQEEEKRYAKAGRIVEKELIGLN